MYKDGSITVLFQPLKWSDAQRYSLKVAAKHSKHSLSSLVVGLTEPKLTPLKRDHLSVQQRFGPRTRHLV